MPKDSQGRDLAVGQMVMAQGENTTHPICGPVISLEGGEKLTVAGTEVLPADGDEIITVAYCSTQANPQTGQFEAPAIAHEHVRASKATILA